MKNEQSNNKEPIKEPIYKKWYFWLIIALVVIAIIGAIFGGTRPQNDTQENTEDSKKQTIYYIGENVTIGSFEYTINSVSNTNTINTSSGLKTTENNYIWVYVTAKNVNNELKYLSVFGIKLLLDKNEYTWKYVTNNMDYSVAPGISRTFWLVFETPSKNTDEDYCMQIGSNDEQIIMLKKR